MQVKTGLTAFVLILLTQAPGIKTDMDEDESQNNNNPFHVDQHKDTREFVKSELYMLFDKLANSINEKLRAFELKIEKSLSDSFLEVHQKVAKIDMEIQNLTNNISESNSFCRNLTAIDFTLEKSFMNLSDSVNEIHQKQVATALENENLISKLSESFNESLSKGLVELGIKIETNQQSSYTFGNQLETIVGNERRSGSLLLSGVANSTHISTSTLPSPNLFWTQLPRTVVEELVGDAGTIDFDGRKDFHLHRKIWIIAARGNEYLRSVIFKMEKNSLGSNGRLLLWEVGHKRHEYNGSQTNWRDDVKFTSLHMLVVTLVLGNPTSVATSPSFKLNFNITRNTYDWMRSTEVMRKDGLQSVSYPPLNTQNYPLGAMLHTVVAPPNGSPFRMTLKFLDVPNTPPTCSNTGFQIWFLQESPTETKFVEVPETAFSRCGRRGNISELIGQGTVAVVRFYSGSSATEVGRGFRLEVDDST